MRVAKSIWIMKWTSLYPKHTCYKSNINHPRSLEVRIESALIALRCLQKLGSQINVEMKLWEWQGSFESLNVQLFTQNIHFTIMLNYLSFLKTRDGSVLNAIRQLQSWGLQINVVDEVVGSKYIMKCTIYMPKTHLLQIKLYSLQFPRIWSRISHFCHEVAAEVGGQCWPSRQNKYFYVGICIDVIQP